jgi:hypothetical protein
MTDIVDRLRDRSYSSKFRDPLAEAAANEIERLRAENARLRGLCGLSPRQEIPEIES